MTRGDAWRAATLFAGDPTGFGGIVLRGDSPEREALVEALMAQLVSVPVKRLPRTADPDALTGGLDLGATLAGGVPVQRRGLIELAAGGVLVVPMAERLEPGVAAVLGQALDGGRLGLVLLDDCVGDERVAAGLAERCAFWVDPARDGPDGEGEGGEPVDALPAIVATAAAFGVGSARAAGFALRAFRALGGDTLALVTAARLVLGPRATQLPPDPDAAQQAPQHDPGESGEQENDGALEDRVIEAVRASLPPDVLAVIAAKGRGKGGGATGERRKSTLRGRSLGSRAGLPRGGARLALIDTLRAAAPWQRLRRKAGDARVRVRTSDLRIKRYEARAEAVTIFAVDASGSAAAARLGEAKGAVELLLAEAYVKRTQVALIAFRGEGAELLLPPTRSLTRARRALADLPGGGGTPLAAGIDAARELAEAVKGKGRTPFVVMLTDGRANIANDGSAARPQAMADAERAAQRLAKRAIASICIDTAARPRPEAELLARAMAGRYVPLPQGGAAGIGAAITALR